MAAASLLVAAGFTVGVAPSATAVSGTITGTVYCAFGNNTVNGIHVDVATGADGFASWTSTGPTTASYSYTLSQSTSTYFVNVGCGGSPAAWGGSFTSPLLTASSYDLYCTVVGGGKRCATG